MNRSASLLLLVVLLGSSVTIGAPQKKQPPQRYVDKGACPFECCTYRGWTTESTTIAYERPDLNSRKVGRFKAGSKVFGLTGRVITTTPGKFVVTKDHGKYKRGDVLWVYTPLGEGFYKVWFKGKMYDQGLDVINGPFEQTIPPCDENPSCWGTLKRSLKLTWWVKVRSAEGWVGWTDKPENFGNKDACG